MVIINPIKCEGCGEELQPEEILVGTNSDGDLIRACKFCQKEVIIKT